jgi:hypothetical protein
MRQASLFSRLHTIAASRRSSSMSASSDRTMLRPFASKEWIQCQLPAVHVPGDASQEQASVCRLPACCTAPSCTLEGRARLLHVAELRQTACWEDGMQDVCSSCSAVCLGAGVLTTSASAGSGVKPVGMTRCVTAAAAAVTGGVAGTARPLATTASGAAAKLALAVRCVRFFASAYTQMVVLLKTHVICTMCHDWDAVHPPCRCMAEALVRQPMMLTARCIAGLNSHAPCAHTKHVAVATQPQTLSPKEPYLLVHCELDGIGGCARSQIVHPRLQSFLQGSKGAKVQRTPCSLIECHLTETSIVGGRAMHQSNTLHKRRRTLQHNRWRLAAVRHQETRTAGSGRKRRAPSRRRSAARSACRS